MRDGEKGEAMCFQKEETEKKKRQRRRRRPFPHPPLPPSFPPSKAGGRRIRNIKSACRKSLVKTTKFPGSSSADVSSLYVPPLSSSLFFCKSQSHALPRTYEQCNRRIYYGDVGGVIFLSSRPSARPQRRRFPPRPRIPFYRISRLWRRSVTNRG